MSSKRVSASPDSAFFLPSASGGNGVAGNDYEDLRNVALADMQKKGASKSTYKAYEHVGLCVSCKVHVPA